MYADLENIEARGKRKKEKRGGLFSFGKKEEPEPAQAESPAQAVPATPKAAPKPEPKHTAQPHPQHDQNPPEPKPESKAVQEPKVLHVQPTPQPKHEPAPPPKAEPAPRYIQPPPEPRPEPQVVQKPKTVPKPIKSESSWAPLTGGKLDRANSDLHEYKKWLNKGYKSGVLTKEQCAKMAMDKEIELGLRPPE